MLILTRKIGSEDEIVIGDDEIRVRVLSVRGNQVRIGIEADKDIPVHRSEIFEKIKQGVAA